VPGLLIAEAFVSCGLGGAERYVRVGLCGTDTAEAFVSCGLGGAERFVRAGLCGADCALPCLAGHHSTYFTIVPGATLGDAVTGGGAAVTRTAVDHGAILTL